MKWGVRNKTAEKRLKMAIFMLLMLSYMHTTIYFFILLIDKYEQVLLCVKIQEKVLINKYGFDTFIKLEFFRLFKLRGRVVK